MTEQKLSPLNIEAIRADFPALDQEVHPGKRLVFLDLAASSQKPRQVIDAMTAYYETSHANVHRGIHVLSERAPLLLKAAARKCARSSTPRRRRNHLHTQRNRGG